jgi:hypothetical protein
MQRRGSFYRISPYTPFVLLHRFGDEVIDVFLRHREYKRPPVEAWMKELLDSTKALRAHSEILDAQEDIRARYVEIETGLKVFGRGVDTAAGRMGVIGGDYLSDLFAKYLLTGKLAYDPENPPPQSAEEEIFRRAVAKNAPVLFAEIVKKLKKSVPTVIYI